MWKFLLTAICLFGFVVPAQAQQLNSERILNLLNAVLDESIQDSITTIDDITREVRDGNIYHVDNRYDGLADGADADMLIVTPTNKQVHLRKNVAVTGTFNFFFYEGVTTSDDGTQLTTINRNRNSSDATGTTVFSAPTVTDLGTELTDELIPGGESGGFFNNTEAGAASADTAVWILEPDTKYLLRLTNDSGGTQNVSITIDFYEFNPDA